MSPVRVMIVEDSGVVREHLNRIISADPRLVVAGVAQSGEEAIEMLDSVAPDVISMDIQLPGIEGFEATRRIMARRPTPIVVVSGIGSGEVNLTMKALRAGALAVVEKPVAVSHDDYEAIAGRLCTQLVIMSDVKVIRRRESDGAHADRNVCEPPPGVTGVLPFRILAVAASTGGPNALLHLLTGLGPDFRLPIVIVQHMNPGFMEGFAEWLGSVTPFPASVVTTSTLLRPGNIYVAPSNRHVAFEGGSVVPDDSPPVGGHRPSANVLFTSVSRGFGAAVIGILLTGMGEDGAAGLSLVRSAGGYTIGEDETTAVV
ncbi:MAG TPA: chemotaxis protein CheB, partial [Bryobacteraceae bacterium]|nr:chemotaxis protein CheB [Bryobacteraceae bacterium]